VEGKPDRMGVLATAAAAIAAAGEGGLIAGCFTLDKGAAYVSSHAVAPVAPVAAAAATVVGDSIRSGGYGRAREYADQGLFLKLGPLEDKDKCI